MPENTPQTPVGEYAGPTKPHYEETLLGGDEGLWPTIPVRRPGPSWEADLSPGGSADALSRGFGSVEYDA